MNENLNLEEILKDCQKGTKLYSPICGEVEFVEILSGCDLSIKTISKTYDLMLFCKNGQYLMGGECVLFPSKGQRDWSKFQPKKSKFDPKTLMPFDRVLQFDTLNAIWTCDFYSHKINEDVPYPYECVGAVSNRVIPYNEETKHLVGTNKEAPEFYRHWEE